MRDPEAEGARWLDQAENDIAFARYALAGGFYHQVCFICQQAGEKALKAVLYRGGARSVLGHSLVMLLAKVCEHHPAFDHLRDAAAELDLFYVPTRYPNGLPDGTPHATFTRAQAERALATVETVLSAVRGLFRAGGRQTSP